MAPHSAPTVTAQVNSLAVTGQVYCHVTYATKLANAAIATALENKSESIGKKTAYHTLDITMAQSR